MRWLASVRVEESVCQPFGSAAKGLTAANPDQMLVSASERRNQCFVKARKWGKRPACHSIHRIKRKLEAYATKTVAPKLSVNKALEGASKLLV